MMKQLLLYSVILLVSLLSNSLANAAEILNIKGSKVLVDIGDLSLKSGDSVYSLDSEGKKKALLEISQIKGNKAIAKIIKGKPRVGMSLIPKRTENFKSKNIHAISARPHRKGAYGVLAGLNMNSMAVKLVSETANLSGSSFSFKGFYQQHIDGPISVRAGAGYETLVAEGNIATASCRGSMRCDLNISYLGLDALIRYSLSKAPYEVWIGGGLGFLIALSKSSTALDEAKISTNQSIQIAGGVDYSLNKNNFIPVELIYSLFPSNSTATASQIMIRAGYGWGF